MVRSSWRHEELGRNDLALTSGESNNKQTVLRLTNSLALVKLDYLRENPQKLYGTRFLMKQ
jgi:hypothetical protein